MADFNGTVGAKILAALGFPNVHRGRLKATSRHYIRDEIELPAAAVVGSRTFCGTISSSARLDPTTSKFWFDAFGAGVTVSLGIDDTDPDLAAFVSGASTKLVSAVSVAADSTAAGASAMSNIDKANYNKRVWEILGLTADPGCDIKLWWTWAGADPASASFTWSLQGS